MKPRLRHIGTCCAALAILAGAGIRGASADIDKVGTTAGNFLSVGSGPRILGMGGATLGLGDDLAAGSWNPAALGWMQSASIAISHASLDEESAQEWVALGGRLGSRGTFWSLSGLYQGDGTFEGRDASNNPTGTFSTSSMAIGAHVSQRLGPMFTLGLGVKSVHEKLADVTGSGFTFDGGLMFRRGMVGFGVAAQNVGGQMKYPGASYNFPASYGVGASLSHFQTGLSLAIDANFPDAYYSDVRTGLEWKWKHMVALRAGYRHEMGAPETEPLAGPTFGMGAGTNGLWFDYGYLAGGDTGGEHRLALTFFPSLWSGFGSDPFGQGDMPRGFDKPRNDLVGPPVPSRLKTNSR